MMIRNECTKTKFTRNEIEPLIEFMRRRLNEYELHFSADGKFALGEETINDNQLISILKRDAEKFGIKMPGTKRTNFIIRNVLKIWRKKLLEVVVSEGLKVYLINSDPVLMEKINE